MSAMAGGAGFIFGWAKPVPVNFRHLRSPKRDMALVALAGPGANLMMAVIWALLMVLGKTLYPTLSWLGEPLYLMGHAGITINIILGVLNLLPIPPLDGSRVMVGLCCPIASVCCWRGSSPSGMVILLLLLITGLLQTILWPPIRLLSGLFYSIFGY